MTTTTKTLIFHPTTDANLIPGEATSGRGGKWHATAEHSEIARCGGRAFLLDPTHTIQYDANTDPATIHPICCRRCVKAATK